MYVHIGGGGEDCIRQTLCAQYVNETSCSENITSFTAQSVLGRNAMYSLTFNSSTVDLTGSTRCEVSIESSCSIEHIGLRERCDECIVSSKTSNSIEFSCGPNGIRGSTGTAQVLYTPMDRFPVFNIVQLSEGESFIL